MSQGKNIIGYFHICQTTNWRRSFDLIMIKIRSSGLYDVSKEIRLGIVNDKDYIIQDERLNDPKFVIVVHRHSSEFERPTLLHMREYSEKDPEKTVYWYAHTKGLRHFGGEAEKNVLDWINLLLYWNMKQWKMAIQMLNYYDTYGCNGVNSYLSDVAMWDQHYSGNFWWANRSYISILPNHIGPKYCDPEFWICKKKDNLFCNIYTNSLAGGQNYCYRLDPNLYELPEEFDIENYKNYNCDLSNLSYSGLIDHYLNHGKNEPGRRF